MSIMGVQIQCKSSLNQGLTEKLIERLEPNGGGGEEWAGPVFPHPLLRSNMQLAKCFHNLNFSLGQDNHKCSDTVQE